LAANPAILATGRRKEAVARVRLMEGDGRMTVNDKTPLEYFCRSVLVQAVNEPLKVVDAKSRFDVTIKVVGGGTSGQAGAAVQGIARALVISDAALRPALKAAGLLTRDARAKERKKPGLKRARKAPQYTKR
jgi:small subunit ribosomal protein S9